MQSEREGVRKRQNKRTKGKWSIGLVVMLGDSCPRGSEFESKCQILQGNVSHLHVVKL